jgi:hypothetical protein
MVLQRRYGCRSAGKVRMQVARRVREPGVPLRNQLARSYAPSPSADHPGPKAACTNRLQAAATASGRCPTELPSSGGAARDNEFGRVESLSVPECSS